VSVLVAVCEEMAILRGVVDFEMVGQRRVRVHEPILFCPAYIFPLWGNLGAWQVQHSYLLPFSVLVIAELGPRDMRLGVETIKSLN